jgi:succinylglutamic semialdehyde dehydrogenase
MSLWINGEWQSGHGPARSKTNPVSQALLWQGNDADAGQVALAVSAARRAFPAWARQPFSVRQAIVKNLPRCWKRTKPS